MEIYRGDIFYIRKSENGVGSEQDAGRPAVVISNDKNNEYSEVIEVVYMTTQAKTELPTHVKINSSTVPSTVLCEQIHSISKERIKGYMTSVTADELNEIDKALAISIGIENVSKDNTAKIERDIYTNDYMMIYCKSYYANDYQ